MDARAEYVIRIPVAALHPRRGSPRSSRPEPITRALRDVLMVLSAEPPLLRPGRFVLQVRAGGVYHRLRVEVPDLRDMPRLDATPALSGDPARDAPDGEAWRASLPVFI